MSERKRPLDEDVTLEEARAKRQATLKVAAADGGDAPASASAAASSVSAHSDEADGAEAAYFDREEDDVTTNGHGVSNGASADGGRTEPPPAPAPSIPSSVDSTVEPDERADALEAYMAQIEAQQGALANRPAPVEENSRVVLLEQLLTPATAADADELHATRMETGRECERWGELLRVHAVGAFDEEMQPLPDHVAGRLFVEFTTADCARRRRPRATAARAAAAAAECSAHARALPIARENNTSRARTCG